MTSTSETCESSETAAQLKYCSISPKKELNFVQTKNVYTSRMLIANPSPKKPILFRIRINASEQYSVSPSAGFILPKGSRVVQITFSSKTEIEERCKDMFLIQVLQCSGDDYVEEPREILSEFTKLIGQGLESQNLKLKVHFEINPELTLKLKTNISSNSQIPPTHAKKAIFFQDMGSPARIHGLKSSSPIVNNICSYKKSQFDTNHSEKPLVSPSKLCNSNFRQNIVKRFSYTDCRGNGSPTNIDYIVETKPSDSSPTKSYASYSSGAKGSGYHHQRTDSRSIYQKKFESLEKRFQQQEECLTKILQEKDSFLNEINKFKFTFTSETLSASESAAAETTKNSTKEVPRYEMWQLMIISIIFLILGSLMRDLKNK